MTSYFIQGFIYLIAAVIAVPLAKRLGLGSVLGYLIAGVVIGPILGLVGQETNQIQHFAEFGVVMMLFLVGLELEPKMLWDLRKKLIGLGGLQLGITTAIVTGIAMLLAQPFSIALTIGMIFSLSSTAIVLKTFAEKGVAKTSGGQSAFSVLLFQDIAVIPMLALIPLLAIPELMAIASHGADTAHHSISWVEHTSPLITAIIVLGAIAGVVVGGHYISRPLFKYVASSGLREVFTATALAIVIGIAALMSLVGLSPALGTFLAGVVLANSEFKHELEATIDPFKGLLLGLFFITVGAGVSFTLFAEHALTIIGLTLGLMLVKSGVLLVIAKLFKLTGPNRWLFALSLAQAGEFGFVLLSFSTQNAVIPTDIAQLLNLVVALSMFLTPLLFILYDRAIVPHYQRETNKPEADSIDKTGTVLIAGIGRFGQIVHRILDANGITTVVLDHSVSQVDILRKFNVKAFYGDATRSDLLETAGVDEASLFIVAIDDPLASVELVKHLRQHHPHLTILARAFDRGHDYRLRHAGADIVIKETFHSAIKLGTSALEQLGTHPFLARQKEHSYQAIEDSQNEALYQVWAENVDQEFQQNQNFKKLTQQVTEQIKKAMHADRYDLHSSAERAWTPPPKSYTDDL